LCYWNVLDQGKSPQLPTSQFENRCPKTLITHLGAADFGSTHFFLIDMKTILLLIFMGISVCLSAQPTYDAKRDYEWIMGKDASTGVNLQTFLEFKFDTVRVRHESGSAHALRETNASICDSAGNLLFFTNGCVIQDTNYHYLPSADTINLGYDWNKACKSSNNITKGMYHVNGTWILPVSREKFKVLSINEINIYKETSGMRYVNIWQNRDSIRPLYGEDFERQFISMNLATKKRAVTRHANGRDWWMVNEHYTCKKYVSSFIDSSDNQYDHQVYEFSQIDTSQWVTPGQACFSPDGNTFVAFDDFNACKIFQFNRCTGELSNLRWIEPLLRGYALNGVAGCAISSNSRFLYLFMRNIIGQYDLQAPDIEASAIKVAEYDGYLVPNPPPATPFDLPHNFYQGQLGPDGKIYIFSSLGRVSFSVIEHPDSFGLACDVRQHKYEFGGWGGVVSPPRFPNYRLGPVTGSPCDTLTSATHEPEVIHARMQLRPNPATSYTVADLSVPDYSANMQLTLTVSDLSGSEVGTYAVPPYAALQRIETGGLPNGMYFVALKSRGRVIKTEKLVVLRE
jgi:hypothetical protein